MDKKKKRDPKKILVRNTELPVPKTKLIVEEKPDTKKSEPKTHKPKTEIYKPKFQSPELNSALKIAEKIDKVGKAKNKAADVAFCEKVTRKVNFPSDRPIYKDLIPLQVPARTPPILSSREPLPQKDKEPVLSEFAKLPETKEYVYLPSIKSDRQAAPSQLNNLRLYKIIQMNT